MGKGLGERNSWDGLRHSLIALSEKTGAYLSV
jgi:hypothetical protein